MVLQYTHYLDLYLADQEANSSNAASVGRGSPCIAKYTTTIGVNGLCKNALI